LIGVLRSRLLVYGLIGALLVGAVPKARADTPLIVVVGGWLLSGAVVGAGIWAANRVLDEVFPPPKEQSTRTVTITVTHPDGSKTTTVEVHKVDPPLTDVDPTATISLPADWTPPPSLPGDLTAGSVTAQIISATQAVQQSSTDLQVGFDVITDVAALGGIAGTETMQTDIVVDASFVAPPGAPGGNTFSFTPNGNVRVSTIDYPQTTASAAYILRVDSPELGQVFEGGYSIDQGSLTPVTIGLGIPGAVLDVLGPGVLNVDLAGAIPVQFTVPEDLTRVRFAVTTRFDETATVVPEPGGIALVLGGLAAAMLLGRRFQSP
jgi:hypothetical protein